MWKYTVAELRVRMGDELNLRDDLNGFGIFGWELVCMEWIDCKIEKETKRVICTFKQRAE